MDKNKGPLRHGHRANGIKTKEYKTWLGIKRRCTDPNVKEYPRYGGRGIKVCPRWDASFDDFLSDMGAAPTDSHQIDRIDPNGWYRPENCRWVTRRENQSQNKTNLVRVSAFGIDYHNAAEACRAHGINLTTFFYRVGKGLDHETALTPRRIQSERARETYLPKSHPDRLL